MSPTEIQNTFGSTLTSEMSVFSENVSTGPTGGRFDVLAASGIACRRVAISPVTSGPRAELLVRDQLNWTADYTLPSEGCQVELDGDGVRWQLVAGTIRARRGIAGELLMNSAQMIRVVS